MVFLWRAATFTSIGAVGLLTNAVVVLVMLKSKALMKIESSKFIVNQSLIDAVTSFLIITSHMNLVDYLGLIQDNYKDNILADEVLCRFWNFDLIQWSFNTASTINLVIMTTEKYLKIVHPMWYRAKVCTVHQRIALALPWIIGPVYQFSIYLHTLDVIDNVCVLHIWPSVLLSRIVGVFVVSFEFFIPICLFIFCYSRILKTLKERSQRLNMSGEGNSKSQSSKYINTKTAGSVKSTVSMEPKGNGKDLQNQINGKKQVSGELNLAFTNICKEDVKDQNSDEPNQPMDDGQTTKESGEILDVTKLQKNQSDSVKEGKKSSATNENDNEANSSTICCFHCNRRRTAKSPANSQKSAVKRSQATETGSRNSHIDKQNVKSQRKVIRILITVSVAFFICWVCNQTIIFLSNIGLVDGEIFFSFIYTISGITAYMNCCVNPFIYVAQFHKFRHIAYNGLLKCNWNY